MLSQFTYNAFRFVELNLHKLVVLLWKTSWMWQESGLKVIKKKLNYYFFAGGAIGVLPRASNWLETALVRHMVWALTGWPPTPSTSAAMLAAYIRIFPKHNLWIWRWARALNFFGRPWRGLFWVEPVLLNRCMVLVTVLQLRFRVLAIFL